MHHNFQLKAFVAALIQYRFRWIVPAAVVFALAAAYAVVRSNPWEASQALVMRDEASAGLNMPGRFNDEESMKHAQETALEIARSRSVAAAALEQVDGRPAKPGDIAKLQGNIEVAAPNGAEFGRTEVFYIHVKDNNPQRAVALAAAVSDQLEVRLQKLRNSRAESVVGELAQSASLAQKDLADATGKLSNLEQQVGPDLGELRILNEIAGGESNLRSTLIDLKQELRLAKSKQQSHQQLLAMLAAAQTDSSHLIATPNRLLESQPALRRLKDGLIDSQLQAAQLLGQMTGDHPKVKAALAGQEQIRDHLHAELALALRGVQAELALGEQHQAELNQQIEETTARMQKLAALRAPYANLVQDVERRINTLKQTESHLADARAGQASAGTSSLLTRLDPPLLGDSPVGTSRALILFAGLIGGLATGLGFVFLTVPFADPSGENEVELPQPAEQLGRLWEEELYPGILGLKETLSKVMHRRVLAR